MTEGGDHGEERRSHARAVLRTRLDLAFDKTSTFASFHTVNLSAGGVFVAMEEPPEPGTVVAFGVMLGQHGHVRGRAEVVWVRTETEGPERPAGAAFKLVQLREGTTETIGGLVNELLSTDQGGPGGAAAATVSLPLPSDAQPAEDVPADEAGTEQEAGDEGGGSKAQATVILTPPEPQPKEAEVFEVSGDSEAAPAAASEDEGSTVFFEMSPELAAAEGEGTLQVALPSLGDAEAEAQEEPMPSPVEEAPADAEPPAAAKEEPAKETKPEKKEPKAEEEKKPEQPEPKAKPEKVETKKKDERPKKAVAKKAARPSGGRRLPVWLLLVIVLAVAVAAVHFLRPEWEKGAVDAVTGVFSGAGEDGAVPDAGTVELSQLVEGELATAVNEIAWVSEGSQTLITVSANGPIDRRLVGHGRLLDPARLVVRIVGIAEPFTQFRSATDVPLLAALRVEHVADAEPPELHLVMDLGAEPVEIAGLSVTGNALAIQLEAGSGAGGDATAGVSGTEAVATGDEKTVPDASWSAVEDALPSAATAVETIEWAEDGDATVITITANGFVGERRVRHHLVEDRPARYLIRLFGITEGFEEFRTTSEVPHLSRLRVGHYRHQDPPELHLNLVMGEETVEIEELNVDKNVVTVRLVVVEEKEEE